MFDLIALGETLIDFTPCGCAENGAPRFAQNPGGAPANVLAQAARLGAKTAFLGMVGRDGFGTFLRETMRGCGIDTGGLRETDEVHTTLAFVQLDARGERTFSFYRKPGADVMLRPEDVDEARIRASRIFHLGSLSLTDEPVRSATHHAVAVARQAGCLVSYDPNYRPPLWPSESEAVEAMRSLLPSADLVKVSEEELSLLTGCSDAAHGSAALAALGPTLILVSMGGDGACFRCGEHFGHIPAYPVHAIDTNGAGDSFFGAILSQLRNKTLADIRAMDDAALRALVSFGCAAGALTTTAHGAIPAMPDVEQIAALLQQA